MSELARVTQAHVVTGATADASQRFQELALFNPDGSPFTAGTVSAATTSTNGTVKKAAANADNANPTATDLATALVLANGLKVTVNGLQGVLRTAGILS